MAKKPFLLKGQDVSENEYKSYIPIDFAKCPDEVKDYFVKHINDLDTFFMLLSTYYGVKLYERESLIIFDEVQMYPKARECIKYLVADGRYDYIETGSLISIKENVKDIVIPSEERHLNMYPLDFEEFCDALGEEQICRYIRKCFADKTPLENELHDKAMLLFKQYMLVGGMPQSVIAFIESRKDFDKADIEKRDILALYRSDIMKIDNKYRSKVLTIFDQIPGLLSQHEKRVVFNDVSAGSKAVNYEETFFWLSDSMISNECFLCNDPNVGLSVNENRAYVKCYIGDTGLLYENAIAQMLTANGHKLYFYTQYNTEKHRNDIEIDFIISNNSKLKYKMFPIEVKSGKKYSIESLKRFKEKYKARIGECYVIHPRNLSFKDDIICIPPYMTICL